MTSPAQARHRGPQPRRTASFELFPVFEARENDVGGDRYPKCVIADEGDLDEYPDNRKPRENKREDEYKIDSQCVAPRGPR